MNEWQQMFFLHHIRNSMVAPTSRRYHPDIIRWCIELYCRSPAAYNHVRSSEVLTLPSEKTIQNYRLDLKLFIVNFFSIFLKRMIIFQKFNKTYPWYK